MRKLYFLLLVMASSLANAQRVTPFRLLTNDSIHHALAFRSSEGLYLEVTDTSLERIIIHPDTRVENGKNHISHWLTKKASDTVYAGSFTFPGLYVLSTELVKRSGDSAAKAGYHQVNWERIPAWQRNYYISFTQIGKEYKGISWRRGSDTAKNKLERTFLYCYSPGISFNVAPESSLLPIPDLMNSDTASWLRTFSDSLIYAFNNTNKDSLQKYLALLADQIADETDSGRQVKFSFYMDGIEPVRLLVKPSAGAPVDTIKARCSRVFHELVRIVFDSNCLDFKVRDANGELPTIMFTPARQDELKTTSSNLFTYYNDYVLERTDPYNTAASLAALAGNHINGDNRIFPTVVSRNGSSQVVVLYTIVGRKTAK